MNNKASKAPLHLSGRAIVTGNAKFIGDDIKPEGMLYARFLPSRYAHAKIVKIDIAQAQQLPGVVAVLTAKDICGENQIGHTIKDEPLLPEDEVCYAGQPVVLVLATSEKLAEHALGLINVTYQELPAILTIPEALQAGNLYVPERKIERGDIALGFSQADYILEGEVATGTQEHLYLETQRCIAVPGDDANITLYSSTQSTAEIQEIAARVLGIDSKDVVVDVKRLGGAFGGKERSATLFACLAAFAAYKIKKPVELLLSRHEDLAFTGKRHPFLARYKVGFTKTGKILAYDVHLSSNGGAYVDLSLPVTERAMFHADNAYYLPNVRIIGAACRTNLPPNTAFRGFGAPQGIFTIESVLEAIADKLHLDYLQVREINFYREGEIAPYNQVVRDACHHELASELRSLTQYEKLLQEVAQFNSANKYLKRGVGVVPVKFGISFTFTTLNQGTALVWIYADGSISMSHGGIEMGQEINTKVAQVVARELGVSIDRIRVESSNTQRNANASPTAASSGADINGNAALHAAQQIKERLQIAAVKLLAEKYKINIEASQLVFADNKIFPQDESNLSIDFAELAHYTYLQRLNLGAQGYYKTPDIHFDRESMQGSPFYYYVYGIALAVAEVDILTGMSKLLKVQIVHDIAQTLNREVDLGQITGAFLQGFGYCTMEEMPCDAHGKYMATTLSTYKIPTICDMPEEFAIHLWERERAHASVMGSKAIGEPPLIYGFAAYFAIKHALAVLNPNKPVKLAMPATPEAILLAARELMVPG